MSLPWSHPYPSGKDLGRLAWQVSPDSSVQAEGDLTDLGERKVLAQGHTARPGPWQES